MPGIPNRPFELFLDADRGLIERGDRVYGVDDRSPDATVERAREVGDPRVEVIVHEVNQGVGAAIVTGYRRALADKIACTVVTADDNQIQRAQDRSPSRRTAEQR